MQCGGLLVGAVEKVADLIALTLFQTQGVAPLSGLAG